PTPPDPNDRPTGVMAQLSHYVDAAELYWNSYILIYDSSSQLQLFRSAQDRAQSVQNEVRSTSDAWMARGQILSDRVARQMQRLFDRGWFWLVLIAAVCAVVAYRNRRFLLMQLHIMRLRRGSGPVNDAVVEELF